jgi:RNA polymerase sigma-B factor
MAILTSPTVNLASTVNLATTNVSTVPDMPVAPVRRYRRSSIVDNAAPSRFGGKVDPTATTEQLLLRIHQLPVDHPDRARLRVRVIEKSLPLANTLARRHAGRGQDLDDLTQAASVALIKAVDGFDPSREVPFAGYAVPCIVGALKRHFRDTAWGMRVPRSAQDLGREAATATGELSQRWGRTPTGAELAAHLYVDVDTLRFAVGASTAYGLTSLNTAFAGTDSAEGTELIDTIGGVDRGYTNVDDRLALSALFARVPLRHQRILAMRFYGQMTQAQIGAELGLSQMHVSRLLRQSLARLRTAMPD